MSIIEDYHLKNNSVPVMDSLLMNELTIKCLIGLPTTEDPIAGSPFALNRYNTVNSKGEITAVDGKAITIKADPGYKIPGDPVIPVNSRKPLNVGMYHYEDAYNTKLGILQQQIQRFGNGGQLVHEPTLFPSEEA